MKAKNTLIITADGENVYLYKNEGIDKGIEKLKKEFHQDIPKGSDIVTDRAGMEKMGRGSASMQNATHGYNPSDNPREEKKIRFLRDVLEYVNTKVSKGDYDRLVIIAPPQTLGDIRELLRDSIKGKIVAEIDKDLTSASIDELKNHLKDVIAY
jgi:protein required for attachment to host cells